MKDCSDCDNVIRTGQDYFCKIMNDTYLINNYPEQGEGCVTWKQGKTQKNVKEQNNRDPLLSWLKRSNKAKADSESHDVVVDEKEQKIIESYDKNANNSIEDTPKYVAKDEVSFINGLGWIIATILIGVLIGMVTMKLI